MPTIKKLLILTAYLISLISFAQQTGRFESEIQKFEAEDSTTGYQEDFILFTGSSSIRLWKSLTSDMEGLSVLNRGFGGATLEEMNVYWNRIAGEHKPDLVVLYCGENDIAENATAGQVMDRFTKFMKLYTSSFPSTPLIYIAMKPSLARWNLWEEYQEADSQISAIISQSENATFIDLSPSMLKKNGTLKKNIFIQDGLHMNTKGYEGWTTMLRPIIEAKLSTQN
jgi:lysophospholipase L1-like esterase